MESHRGLAPSDLRVGGSNPGSGVGSAWREGCSSFTSCSWQQENECGRGSGEVPLRGDPAESDPHPAAWYVPAHSPLTPSWSIFKYPGRRREGHMTSPFPLVSLLTRSCQQTDE